MHRSHLSRFAAAKSLAATVAFATGLATATFATVVATLATAPTPAVAASKPSKKKPPSKAVNPNAPEVVAPGDIPDNQAFVPYRPSSGGYTISVPEGWGRTENGGAVTFTDKYNSITVAMGAVTSAPTIDTVRATGLADVSSDPTYKFGKIATVKTAGGPAIRATYEIGSAPNKVTGKKALLAVERYVFFGNGTQVVVTLSGAKGADNVDPWKTVTDSVRVG
jgi:hypothetical protein